MHFRNRRRVLGVHCQSQHDAQKQIGFIQSIQEPASLYELRQLHSDFGAGKERQDQESRPDQKEAFQKPQRSSGEMIDQPDSGQRRKEIQYVKHYSQEQIYGEDCQKFVLEVVRRLIAQKTLL